MRVTTESRRTDLACLVVLLLAGILLRVPALDRIAINPDESQYEAIASYLVGTGQSAFAVPHASGGTYALFKLFALTFGPYSTFEMRVFVALLSLLVALGTYALVRRIASPWAALAAGLVFLHYNLYNEGLAINREWFSIPCLLGAGLLYLRGAESSTPRTGWALFASGAVASAALWFKMQAAFLLPAIPMTLVWTSYREGNLGRSGRLLVAFGAGCLAGLALYLGGFALAGTLGDYVGSLWRDWSGYTVGNSQDGGLAQYLTRLYDERPFRPVLTIGFAAAITALALSARARGRTPLALANPTAVLCSAWVVTGLVTVSLGARFFDHYFLFLVFPVAALLGLALDDCLASRLDARFALALCAILIVDRARTLAPLSPAGVVEQWPASAPVVLYVLVAVGVVTALATRGMRRAPAGAAVLIGFEVLALVALGQTWQQRHAGAESGRHFEALVDRIGAEADAGDRLFVWGWAPEIYTHTRQESASHVAVSQYVVGDIAVLDDRRSTLQPEYAAELMRDLRERRPRYIVDAARRSWTLQAGDDPWIYDLERYPQFELVSMLESEYEEVGEFDGCRLHRRRSVAPPEGNP
ncbi:MAG: hypothetical protein GY716_02770 [bacterium]|nr:hypothetical protein [bacterium]